MRNQTLEWHVCDWCRKEATRHSLPMLGLPPDARDGAIPRLWVCAKCRPALWERLLQYIGRAAKG